MATPRKIIVNGRFLGGPKTAVNSVAHDLTTALVNLVGKGTTGWSIEVAIPQSLAEATKGKALPLRVVGQRNGIAWEQTDLPHLRHEGVVTGFFNTVPLWGRGYVTMLHDAHVFTTPASYGRPTRVWRQVLSRRAGAKGNRVLTVSDYSRETLLRWRIGEADSLGVVPNGLGAVGFLPAESGIIEKLGLSGPYAVALSSLLAHKNIGVLLRAFAQPALSGVTLVLVGKSGREAFEAAGYSVPANVIFAGFVTDGELAALYQSALCVCMPSTEEGFGLPALEGMARGAPAVIAPCAALPEVVGDAGLTASPTDPAQWAAAICALRDNPAMRQALAEKGRLRSGAFTWAAAAQKVISLYDGWFPAR
jgi:glycosyltransferase involved in cell wall biosynthesis